MIKKQLEHTNRDVNGLFHKLDADSLKGAWESPKFYPLFFFGGGIKKKKKNYNDILVASIRKIWEIPKILIAFGSGNKNSIFCTILIGKKMRIPNFIGNF